MSVPIIDTLQPLGKFPAVNDKDVQCGSVRLDAALAAKVNNGDMANALSGKVDKESGKGLSSNDYSDAEKAKVASAANGVATLQNNKVDKVEGKGLSSNDYTDAEKAKVANAETEIAKFNSYFKLV